jgi:hypothetical protein
LSASLSFAPKRDIEPELNQRKQFLKKKGEAKGIFSGFGVSLFILETEKRKSIGEKGLLYAREEKGPARERNSIKYQEQNENKG